MAVVDANYCFLYANIGCQGRISDGGVFHQTTFYKKMEEGSLQLPPPETLPGSNIALPYVIIGDDAFPLQEHIMKPYSGSHAKGSPMRIYNYRLSRARRVVENVFGILASVFRVFRKPLMLSVENAEIVTTACVYLHNFLRKSETSRNLHSPQGTFDVETLDGRIIPGSWREIVNSDTGMIDIPGIPRRSTLQAKKVREDFMNYFVSYEVQVPLQNLYAQF